MEGSSALLTFVPDAGRQVVIGLEDAMVCYVGDGDIQGGMGAEELCDTSIARSNGEKVKVSFIIQHSCQSSFTLPPIRSA